MQGTTSLQCHALMMTVASTTLQVNSRVLDPPELVYDQQFRPGDRGNWDMRGLKFNRPAKLTSFAIASFMPFHRCGDPHDPGGLPVRPPAALHVHPGNSTVIAPLQF